MKSSILINQYRKRRLGQKHICTIEFVFMIVCTVFPFSICFSLFILCRSLRLIITPGINVIAVMKKSTMVKTTGLEVENCILSYDVFENMKDMLVFILVGILLVVSLLLSPLESILVV